MDLKAVAVNSEEISLEKFNNLSATEKAKIESSSIVPPKLGDDNFGKIKVNYKIPVYKVNFDD